jgi:transcriptional regulator with XRE-family HTH domain
LTQSELAERSGLAVDSVRRIERGQLSPSLQSIAKLAEGMEISPHSLAAAGRSSAAVGPPE